MDDFVLCAVFNDFCAVMNGLRDWVTSIQGPVNQVQIREFAAHLACCNVHLKNPPQFFTRVENGTPPRVYIEGTHDAAPEFEDRDHKLFRKFMRSVLQDALEHMDVPGKTTKEVIELIDKGQLSFIIDDDGNFIKG
jgi:hypothetical protein